MVMCISAKIQIHTAKFSKNLGSAIKHCRQNFVHGNLHHPLKISDMILRLAWINGYLILIPDFLRRIGRVRGEKKLPLMSAKNEHQNLSSKQKSQKLKAVALLLSPAARRSGKSPAARSGKSPAAMSG